jgi:hypothetical protein
MKVGASTTSTLSWKSSARSSHLININTKLEIFSTKLTSQQHQHEVGNHNNISMKHHKFSTQGWHHNNISTKLEIFSTRLASQQHQHEAGNLQHKAGITSTSAQS